MERKVLKQHTKGQKHAGKTNWSLVWVNSGNPRIDPENPELVGKKQFKKAADS